LDSLDFAARRIDFRRHAVDGFFDALFLARQVQDEQTLVPFHNPFPFIAGHATDPL